MVYTGPMRGRRGHSNDDSVGNRKRPEDTERHVAEDIGNRRGPEDDDNPDAPDDVGNRVGGPAPWSRSFLRGKGPTGGGGRGRGKRSSTYKDMEAIYAQQGEGVPRMFRPGFRVTGTGELASVGTDGALKPLGVSAQTGERVGFGPDGGGVSQGGGGHEGYAGGEEGGVEGEGRRKRRRRRKRGRGEGGPNGADGAGMHPGMPAVAGGQPGGHPRPQQQQHGGGFEEEDDGFRYTLKSDPEDKRKAALAAAVEICRHAGRKEAVVTARVVTEVHGPRVVVEIEDKAADGALFGRGSAALSAMTFLVNKIINRYPDDRIRLSIAEAGTWVAAVVPATPEAAPAAPPALVAPMAPAPAPPAPPVVEAAPPAPAADADEDEDDEADGDEEGEDDAADEEGEAEGAEPEAAGADGEAKPARKPRTATRKPAARKAASGVAVRRKVTPRKSPSRDK